MPVTLLYTIFLTFICRLKMEKNIYQPRGYSNISWRRFCHFWTPPPPSSDRVWYLSQTPHPWQSASPKFVQITKSPPPPLETFFEPKSLRKKNSKQKTNHPLSLLSLFLPSFLVKKQLLSLLIPPPFTSSLYLQFSSTKVSSDISPAPDGMLTLTLWMYYRIMNQGPGR